MLPRLSQFTISIAALLLLAGVLVGCGSVSKGHDQPACGRKASSIHFPEGRALPTNANETIATNVARILSYAEHHPNNGSSGDQVATVQLEGNIPRFKGFELNFYVPRRREGPEGCVPPCAYEQGGVYHYFYFKNSWYQLMTALNGDQPMYARWDEKHLIADISTDKEFRTPQPWPPLMINLASLPPYP